MATTAERARASEVTGAAEEGRGGVRLSQQPVVVQPESGKAAARPLEAEGREEGLSAAEIFALGVSIFWRFLQLASAVVAIGVMAAAGGNGLYFLSFRPFIYLVAAMTAVGAWALGNLFDSIGKLVPSRIRPSLTLLLEFVIAWIALSGAAAAAGLTTFADRGAGLAQPGFCQMGLFGTVCGRSKAATAFAFITFFVLLPSLLATAGRAIRGTFED